MPTGPTDLALDANSVDEHAANGTPVGTVTATGGAAPYTFSLTDDAGCRFAIDASTGTITVSDGSQLEYDAQITREITVRATDVNGDFLEESFTIYLNPNPLTLTVNPISDVNEGDGFTVSGTVTASMNGTPTVTLTMDLNGDGDTDDPYETASPSLVASASAADSWTLNTRLARFLTMAHRLEMERLPTCLH
jgi:hypothetical protein